MPQCFMIRQQWSGGGNKLQDTSVVIRRTAALGDVMASVPIADKMADQGYEVTFQAHPAAHCLLRRIPSITHIAVPMGFCHINLDGVYENDPHRRQKHFHRMFFDSANDQLRARGMEVGNPLNCRPRLLLNENEYARAIEKFQNYPKPWIFFCPRSDSYACRQVPDHIWQSASRMLHGTCFWLGTHPSPAGIVDLQCRHLDNLVLWLSAADLLITVDTGPLHIGAGRGIPILAIGQSSSPEWHLNDQNDFLTIEPEELNCLDCQLNLCPVDPYMPPCQNIAPEKIAHWANLKLSRGRTSAVISVYQPELETINRCLECVLPQVDEVIICHDQAGYVPTGLLNDPKIRVVTKKMHDIGYGRKQNFAVRHSTGEFLLLLNDDVFLDPGSVDRMRECMIDQRVGMVSNHLRYPDGTIYHAGKQRHPGEMGWHHRDYKKFLPTLEQPTELENCCGACVLVRREAFYKAGCFDEDFYIFAEDDSMCLSMRREGWKVMFTPRSTGVHMEHQSVKKTGDISSLLARANAAFGRKWGRYLEWNKHRIPGNFDYLKL